MPYSKISRTAMKKFTFTFALLIAGLSTNALAQTYLGNWTANPYMTPAIPQPGNTFNNPYGTSADSPKLYDSQGSFRGNMNANPYDPNSIANPYGQYGSKYSPDSVNNPYGAGNPYSPDSPSNPYGTGLTIIGR